MGKIFYLSSPSSLPLQTVCKRKQGVRALPINREQPIRKSVRPITRPGIRVTAAGEMMGTTKSSYDGEDLNRPHHSPRVWGAWGQSRKQGGGGTQVGGGEIKTHEGGRRYDFLSSGNRKPDAQHFLSLLSTFSCMLNFSHTTFSGFTRISKSSCGLIFKELIRQYAWIWTRIAFPSCLLPCFRLIRQQPLLTRSRVQSDSGERTVQVRIVLIKKIIVSTTLCILSAIFKVTNLKKN